MPTFPIQFVCSGASTPMLRELESGTSLRNYKVPVPAKRHHVCIDGKPHDAARSVLPTDFVNCRNEIAERQSLLMLGFHGRRISR